MKVAEVVVIVFKLGNVISLIAMSSIVAAITYSCSTISAMPTIAIKYGVIFIEEPQLLDLLAVLLLQKGQGYQYIS
ncbi:MAG: hypothetical protein V7L31_11095 [Nostoc sp.]|uniref:hypothetical protein n=1 Tax=Nostoc sp. TaxID=1180 RepID=UPI002FF40770